jgi:hypothetical protein
MVSAMEVDENVITEGQRPGIETENIEHVSLEPKFTTKNSGMGRVRNYKKIY